MAEFPVLKTGAVVQYPFASSTRYTTEFVSFLDGSRQTYSLVGGGLRRWAVQLDLLDAAELASLDTFVAKQQSRIFAFTDPNTGLSAAKCIIAQPQCETDAIDESRSKGLLLIAEVR